MEPIEEMCQLIARYATTEGPNPTALPRLHLIRWSGPTGPFHSLHEPALCFVAQGRKRVIIGPNVYVYDPTKYLIVSVDLPVTGQVIEASPERPYLSVKLVLDPAVLSAMILEAGPELEGAGPASGVTTSTMEPELLDAAIRLLRLLETPRDLPVLAPLAEREILYRLLMGEQAATLRQIALGDGKARRVSRAIDWIRRNYREPFRIKALAAAAAMSPSALHSHFKTVTAMSPLQYQKQLRLQEARRLMLAQAMDAASAAYEVGYESPSQFSREYRRLFGNPPARDIEQLKLSPSFAGSA